MGDSYEEARVHVKPISLRDCTRGKKSAACVQEISRVVKTKENVQLWIRALEKETKKNTNHRMNYRTNYVTNYHLNDNLNNNLNDSLDHTPQYVASAGNIHLPSPSMYPSYSCRCSFCGGQDSVPKYDYNPCLLYTSPSPRDRQKSRMPSSA